MRTFLFCGRSIAAGVILLTGGFCAKNAAASGFVYQFTGTFSGGAPGGNAPWLDATFQDTSGGVLFTVDSAGLADTEYLSSFFFNLNPAAGNVKNLTFTLENKTGTVQPNFLAGIYGGAPTGNRMTQMLGTTVFQCSAKVRRKLTELAAFTLEVGEDQIEVEGTSYRVAGEPERALSIRQLAAIAYGPRLQCPPGMEPGIVEQNVYAGPDIVTKRKLKTGAKQFPTYSFDFHVVVAEVNPATFEIKLTKYVVVHDCGTVINPLVVDGFTYGGVGHGVGGALFENFAYDPDSGQLLASTFMDYLMPTAHEVPRVELHEQVTPSPLHPYGAKGTAEGAYMTTPAAIASAVEDALAPHGIRITEVPITPQMIFDKVTAATADKDGDA